MKRRLFSLLLCLALCLAYLPASAGAAWEEYGVVGNTSVGMIMSTLGVLSCFVFGMIMINVGVRRGWAAQASNDFKNNPSFFGGMLPKDKRTPVGMATVPSTGIDGFSFQLAIVLACMAFGNWFMGLFKAAVAGNGNVEEELGDLLFSAVNAARFVKVDPEAALQKATEKFIARFRRVEELAAGRPMEDMDLAELDKLWEQAKHEA